MTRQESDVLLVIDVQNDFCENGSLEVPDGDAVVSLINNAARAFTNVVLTQDWHPAGHSSFASSHPGRRPYDSVTMEYGDQTLWPDHCVWSTRGADFHPGLDIPHATLILRKGFRRAVDSYSAFFENDHKTETGLRGYLRERDLRRVFIAGLALDFCVRFSVEDAAEVGFETILVEDACRAVDIGGSRAKALQRFTELGIERMPARQLTA